MNRWTRINLTLALLVAVLLTLHLWPGGTSAPDRLTRLGADEVSMVRVERGKRLRLALQRGESGWRMTHPHDTAVDGTRVRQLLAIAGAPVQHALPADAAPARYGLEPPKAVLQLDQLRLQFGDRDLTQSSRYVLVGSRIKVIDDVFFNLLSLPPSHFAVD